MIKEKLDAINQKIKTACLKSGRQYEEITLLAVSKTVNAGVVLEAVQAGHLSFAENKVQEMVNKTAFFKERNIGGLKWHLIGHLQSNKIKPAVDCSDLFHCLDSLKLARKIDDYCKQQNRIFEVLIQINSSGEASKSGITPSEYPEFLKQLSLFTHLRITGLMSIGEFNNNPEDSRTEFKMMKQLFDFGCQNKTVNSDFKYLSMGMSHDFHIAIEEGANLIRVGTAIFGEREYSK